MFLINRKNKKKKAIPIKHKCGPFEMGRPMTKEDLHLFACELILAYYYKHGAEIRSVYFKPDIEYPNIIMQNKSTNRLYYLTIKADYKPIVPKPYPENYYTSFFDLADEAGTMPVFIGVVFEHIPQKGQSEICFGDEFIVEYTGLISIED